VPQARRGHILRKWAFNFFKKHFFNGKLTFVDRFKFETVVESQSKIVALIQYGVSRAVLAVQVLKQIIKVIRRIPPHSW
jgi:hypothetical protein